MAGCCNCLNPGPQQSYIATVQGPDLEQAHSSQVQGTCDTNQEPVTGQVGKKSHSGLKAQLTTLLAMGPTARQNSIELSGMGFTRQSSRYDYGFTKDYLSGNIKFLESKKAHKYTKSKYLAIQPDENPDVVVSALSKKWGLDFPKLLISILGGGEEVTKGNYAMKKAFCKGLVEAVLSTDVWLFTGGLNCGMMKRMGQALTNYAIGRAMVKHRDVVAVGVASLGIVSQKEKLLGSERMPVMYNMDGDSNNSDNEGDGDYDCRDDASAPTHHLEPNHTHFILVGNTDSKLGDEVGIRNELVHMIAKCKIKGSNATVPALHVVFGGDHSTIQTVNDAVTKHQIPVLVIPDSGGAADVLTFAINSRPQTGEDNIAFDVKITHEIKMKLSLDPKCFVRTKDLIKEIIKRRHLINVCDQDFRIDEAILRALMNANRGCKAQDDLHLAVIWNRIDLAKKELLAHRKWKHSELRDSFYYALVNNQPKFVKLFIAEGNMDVKKFLTAQMLVDLYNETSQESYVLHSLLEKQRAKRHFRGSVQFSLEDVGHVLKELVFDTYESDYSSSHFRCSDAVFFKQPLQELFLWAVLLHRFRMAKLFWKLGKPSIGGALLASKILRALSELQKQDPQESAEMHKHAKDFQTMAIDFLNLCYTGDRRRTSLLLVRNLPDWGNSTCLDLAAAARNKQFIAHAAVQNLLNELWMGRLSLRTGLFKIWTSIFFPFLICCVVTFMSKEDPRVPARRISKDSSGNRETHDDLTRSKSGCQTTSYQTCNTDDADDTGSVKTYMTHVTYRQHEEDGLPCWYKMKLFYEAPVISFRLNMISHFLFLGLFSYILLCNFTEEVSIYEMVLMGWVFTLFTEEVRQIFQEDYQTVYHRFDAWLWGYWNCMDLLSLVMFAVGVGLRFHPVTLDAARIILALDLVVFYLRILHIFSASKLLGPKLIMIVRMLVLLVAFLAILLVFLVAFGVACQAILFPNNQDIVGIIKGVFYQSYFQLYGELFLEDIDSEECALLESANVGSMQRCPQHSWFGTLILAFYLFISNILLLNLLIAMLNYTFQAIQDNTDTFWKFQRYQLVKEYYQRPSVVPPLIIVMHVYQMIRWAWDKCFPGCTLYRSANLMKRKLQQDKQIEISTWEEVTGEDYLAEQKKLTNRESHKRMKQTDEKLEALSSKMTKHFEGARLNKAIEGRFNMLEAQIANLECLVNSLHGTGLSSDSSDGLTRAGHLQSLRHHMKSYPPKKGKSATLK
ncbi:transient receptor potential cation channel subfamily M member 2-like isoform X2 [Acanthaster planci]|uniref:Transient receptor potential cation channel subfamily M member 2-like isoform X2 n=1 Tax=Acanthaster planci TaxID=133434 RepID=A0A8B7XWH0_ACAPL|nr:transient receptor potential cation channel subfamily M member 2-like isoform X2 [Acanthaster planci]